MSDPFLSLSRVIILLFVPAMLLFPLVFVLCVPNRANDAAARLRARASLVTLGLATLVALAIWLGLVLTGIRFPGAVAFANFWWVCFFPLWFLGATRAITARNPAWGGAMQGNSAASGTLRSASLVNRERRSPVSRAMWAIPVVVFLLALGAIAARGLMPFPMQPEAADGAVNPDAVPAVHAEVERWRWLLTLGIYGTVFALHLAILPRGIRRTLTEPEPMDAAGSPELAELYDRQRRKRVLGLFWGLGVLLPAFLGAILALPLWFPNIAGIWGLVGGIGGSLLGLAGGAFGTWMTVERARIIEVRQRLERSRVASAS